MSDMQPPPPSLPWGSITDATSLAACPATAVSTLFSIFGPRATSIAAWCAIHARQDSDEAGYRLWLGAFKQLKASEFSVRS